MQHQTYKQSTPNILMIRPKQFGFNAETAESNSFQSILKVSDAQQQALLEFDNAVEQLKTSGINVVVVDDTADPIKPDAIFPNNWISMHADGNVRLYPMATPNRQTEVRFDIIETLEKTFQIKTVIDIRANASESQYLEGTGSIVFDHLNKIAYACRSIRTDQTLFYLVCKQLNYQPILFDAVDQNHHAIYHTNVMLAIGTKFAVICSQSLTDKNQRQQVVESLSKTGHHVIEITFEQMNLFAANLLEVQAQTGESKIILSQTAFNSFTETQKSVLSKYGQLLPIPINTIETIGGGSARCMMAEIFLPVLN